MTSDELFLEIQARNLLVPPNERDDGHIAATLSVGRTKIVDRNVDIGDVLTALGPEAGASFLDNLELIATSNNVIKWTLVLLRGGILNVGLEVVRTNIDSLVTTSVLTAEQGEAIKNLAVVPDVVTVEQVTKAFEGREY